MSSLSAFTNQLLNLSKNLCELYPEDPDLEFTKNSIQFMKKSNPRKIQHLFDTYIAKYKQQILNKEADFFLYRDIILSPISLSFKYEYTVYIKSLYVFRYSSLLSIGELLLLTGDVNGSE